LLAKSPPKEKEEETIKKSKKQPQLEEDTTWKLIEKPKHWGIKDSSQRIDEAIYDG